MEYIQNIFDNTSGNVVNINKNIYKAPLKINRPCKIYGNGSVIVCSGRNAVIATVNGVELHDFRIESDKENTGKNFVLECRDDTVLDKIYVRGNVKRNNFNDIPEIPAKINLGDFRSGAENTYCFPLELCENARLYTDISGISVTPQAKTGTNTITIATEAMSSGISVFGRIYVISSVIREIYLSGKADKNAPVRELFPIKSGGNSNKNADDIVQLQKGQRIQLDTAGAIQIQFVSEYTDIPLEIDGYAFMLQDGGKVSRDEDMIFWGNKNSPDNSVKLYDNSSPPYFSVSTGNLPSYVKKIAVCYSVYGDEPDKIFRFVHNPYIRIFFNNVEKYNFLLENLTQEKTIAGIEIYRHHDDWKLNCIGAGYNAGLKRMCEDYGLEVID